MRFWVRYCKLSIFASNADSMLSVAVRMHELRVKGPKTLYAPCILNCCHCVLSFQEVKGQKPYPPILKKMMKSPDLSIELTSKLPSLKLQLLPWSILRRLLFVAALLTFRDLRRR